MKLNLRFLAALLAAALCGKAQTAPRPALPYRHPAAPVGEWRRADGHARLLVQPADAGTFRFALLPAAGSCRAVLRGTATYATEDNQWVFQLDNTPCTVIFGYQPGVLTVEEPNAGDCAGGAACSFAGRYLPVLKAVNLPAHLTPPRHVAPRR